MDDMKTALIISRCSTNETKQDVKRQTEDLKAKFKGQYKFVKPFEYYQSGTKNDTTNEEIVKKAIELKVDTILVSEISRISRKVISGLIFIEECSNNGINVHIDCYNLQTLNNDKSVNETTSMMLTFLMKFAEIELKQTYRRLKSGRDKYVREGGKLGRKVGFKISDKDLLKKYSKVIKELKQGLSIRKVSILTKVSTGQIHKIKKILERA